MQSERASDEHHGGPVPPVLEPAINLPPVILWFGVAILAVHATREWMLSPDMELRALLAFAFIPLRYTAGQGGLPFPEAAWWSPFTYSLLHADWFHAGVNLVWLAAFGTPVARRLGASRTILLAALASVGGAALHLAFFSGELVPMVGASAVVSGYMGAAARFAFRSGGPGGLRVDGPALPLIASFSDRRFLTFVLVWLGLNFLFGSGIAPIAGEGNQIAWQAHVGGFFTGLLAFSLLDRRH